MRALRLPVRGLELNALVRGEGPLTVLLHGWLDHARSFDALAPLLPGRTIALDHRGHGDSSWGPEAAFYHLVEYVADLDGALAVINAASDGPVRIVGHSMGAIIGLLYAAARPDRVSHVTMIDGAPFIVTPPEVPDRISSWLEDLRGSRKRRLVASFEDAEERLRRFNPQLPPAAAALLARGGVSADPAQGGQLAWKWDPLLRGHSPLPFTESILRALFARVQCPVLLVRADRGMLPEEAEVKRRLDTVRGLQVVSAPGGHHVHLESPEEVARLITAAWPG